MDTAELERATDPGSGGGRTYVRDPKGSDTGGQFTANPAGATSGYSPLTSGRTYQVTPKKGGGGGSAPTAPRSSAKFKTLAMGEDNDPAAVAEMQQLLTALGLGNLPSGVYDKDTEAAVKEAQKRLGVKNPNGKATKALVNKLLNAYDLSPCVKRSDDPAPDDIGRGRPYPGQKYRHGWIPVAPMVQLPADDIDDEYGQEIDSADVGDELRLVAREQGVTVESDRGGDVAIHATPSVDQAHRWADAIDNRETYTHPYFATEPHDAGATVRFGSVEMDLDGDEATHAAQGLRDMAYHVEEAGAPPPDISTPEPEGDETPIPDEPRRSQASEDCAFTVTRSEGDVFDTLRTAVEDEETDAVERAYTSDPSMPYGDVEYADNGMRDDHKKRYPLNTEDHCRNAWSRINDPDNARFYTPEQLKTVKSKILAAGKKYGIEFSTDTQRSCCPDCLDGESHVFRREWTLDGLEIVRGGQGGDGRTVDAYATPFDKPTEVKDQHGHYMETIHRSAFDDVLRGGIGKVKVFYNHGMHLNGGPSERWSVPIGTPLEIRPDGKGLRTITRYNEGADGDQIIEAIRNGAITGYSFRGPIRQSDPPRIPRARDGQPLPNVVRMKLGLTEYGPTPVPYYADASILALRSRLSTLDPQKWDRLVDLLSTSTPEDQEALRTEITATPTEGPGAEDQPSEALRSAADIARRIRVARILRGM